jgi:hypothetical protein
VARPGAATEVENSGAAATVCDVSVAGGTTGSWGEDGPASIPVLQACTKSSVNTNKTANFVFIRLLLQLVCIPDEISSRNVPLIGRQRVKKDPMMVISSGLPF